MDICWPCWGRRCGWPVPRCSCIGVNEPTGACGGPKCPSTVCAGPSVGSGKPIPHAFRAGIPIGGALTSPGPSALYPGGLPFGTCADICSKTLLWVMIAPSTDVGAAHLQTLYRRDTTLGQANQHSASVAKGFAAQ